MFIPFFASKILRSFILALPAKYTRHDIRLLCHFQRVNLLTMRTFNLDLNHLIIIHPITLHLLPLFPIMHLLCLPPPLPLALPIGAANLPPALWLKFCTADDALLSHVASLTQSNPAPRPVVPGLFGRASFLDNHLLGLLTSKRDHGNAVTGISNKAAIF